MFKWHVDIECQVTQVETFEVEAPNEIEAITLAMQKANNHRWEENWGNPQLSLFGAYNVGEKGSDE